MRHFFSKSIINRLNGVLLPIISIGIIFVTGTIIYLEYHRSTQELNKKITNTLELAKMGLFEPLWYMNQIAMDHLSDAIMLDEDIMAIRIRDETGIPLTERIREEFQAYSFVELSNKRNLFYKTVRVERNNKLVGQVDFVFSNQRVIDLMKRHSVSIIILTLLVIIILGTIVHIIGIRFLRKPVNKLKETAIDLAEGNLDRTIDTSRNDELGVLARSFSVMRDAIREQMSEMRYFNDHLEILVNQRTEELSTALEDIKNAKRIAEEANEAKSEFLANMSHELRTPMHAILGFAKLGIGKIDTLGKQKIRDYFQEILYSGERLLNLLNVLLDLSKLEAGKEDYQFKTERLSSVVTTVINELDALTNGMKMEIVFQEAKFEDLISIDKEKIMQVVRNLLSNAIKFSEPENQIEIDIISQSDNIILSVKDTGLGIPEHELQTIFDKFIQSSRTNTGAGGTGLGLAISKKIIEKHQGEIWAENNPSKGATFHIQLPQAIQET